MTDSSVVVVVVIVVVVAVVVVVERVVTISSVTKVVVLRVVVSVVKMNFGSISLGVDFFLAFTMIPPATFLAVTVGLETVNFLIDELVAFVEVDEVSLTVASVVVVEVAVVVLNLTVEGSIMSVIVASVSKPSNWSRVVT